MGSLSASELIKILKIVKDINKKSKKKKKNKSKKMREKKLLITVTMELGSLIIEPRQLLIFNLLI